MTLPVVGILLIALAFCGLGLLELAEGRPSRYLAAFSAGLLCGLVALGLAFAQLRV